jgi:sporulation protein YlmC with PRC-barrel domain
MKTRRSNMTPWLTALLCLSLAPVAWTADDPEPPQAPASQQPIGDLGSEQQNRVQGDMPGHAPREMGTESRSSEATPSRVNKASGILGMAVRNQSDEHLGHIKDLVIDWKTEGVSYAVISTASKALLGMGGKMLAVPLTALTPSSDQKYLILNADKAKVQAAMGFGSDNWPSVANPTWGAEPFWQKETTTPSMSDKPAKDSDTKARQNSAPADDPAMGPESNLGEEPGVAPDRDTPAKPDTAPEANPQSDSKSDSDTQDNAKPGQDPESPPK